jgi:hypothetical protein
VRGGDLRLFRTRLEGPVQFAGDPFRGLIDVEGAGDADPDKARACSLNECVLVSGRDCVRLHGAGGRLLLRQSVVAAGGAALRLEPGRPDDKGRVGVQCILEHATVAARVAAVHLGDAPTTAPPAEPLVVRARDCAFLDPFADKPNRAGLLTYDGSAVSRGLLLWQGDGDVFDKRLHFAAAPASAVPEAAQDAAAWARMWGSPGERRPTEVALAKLFDLDRWALERLALPRKDVSPDGRPAGADLALLGVVKKPGKKN